jgi:hypothetical protein
MSNGTLQPAGQTHANRVFHLQPSSASSSASPPSASPPSARSAGLVLCRRMRQGAPRRGCPLVFSSRRGLPQRVVGGESFGPRLTRLSAPTCGAPSQAATSLQVLSITKKDKGQERASLTGASASDSPEEPPPYPDELSALPSERGGHRCVFDLDVLPLVAMAVAEPVAGGCGGHGGGR